jgi:ribonuclease BN (tRNA processing enzyme)
MDAESLKCFGVGDGFPGAARGHSSFLYRSGGSTILIDCGEPLSSRYAGAGLDYNLIDALVLSHCHADHLGGFLMFLQGLWLRKRTKELTVFLPAGDLAPVRQMLLTAYLFEELFRFPIRFQGLAAGQPFTVGGCRLTPFRTTHLDSLRASFGARHPRSYEAFSFLLETGGRRIGHSADLGAAADLDPLLAQPLDLLVCELAHFTPEDLFARLAGRPLGRLVLVHLSSVYWEQPAAILDAAARTLPGVPCVIAQPGDDIPL